MEANYMNDRSEKGRYRYIIISPVRDEELYIEKTISSMLAQTRKPILWIIVNDGSKDNTGKILDVYSKKYKWIKAIHRENRGYRSAGSGVIEAFYDGYSCINRDGWDFILKLDGDLSFAGNYMQRCLEKFEDNPKLGIGSGTIYVSEGGSLKIDSAGDPLFHVRGASKIYRRACWEKISPLVAAPGWDTIDEIKANFYGWKTETFSGIKLVQHKPTGGAEGDWKNFYKNGIANYHSGYHPVFMFGKIVKRCFQKPYVVASTGLLCGFLSGYLKRMPMKNDKEMIAYIRKQQILRVLMRPSIYG
jgi:glycosyltransferase involved in cell wall biosynthesis